MVELRYVAIGPKPNPYILLLWRCHFFNSNFDTPDLKHELDMSFSSCIYKKKLNLVVKYALLKFCSKLATELALWKTRTYRLR